MAVFTILKKRCARRSNSCKDESSKRCSNDGVRREFHPTHNRDLCFCLLPWTCCWRHGKLATLFYGAASVFVLVFFLAGTGHAAAADPDHSMHEAAAAAAHPPQDNKTSATARGPQEERPLSPRTVRVAMVGGGISSAAAATFLSIMERQLEHERTAKQQHDEKRRTQKEESTTGGQEAPDEDTEQWWMRRPIKFQIDVYEASERFGGRMEYGEIAGRTVELGDVGVNASNFWMTVFHDLLNVYADNLGGTGWSTPGDRVAAAAAAETAATAAPDKTAAATAGETSRAGKTTAAATGEAAEGAASVANGTDAEPADETAAAGQSNAVSPPYNTGDTSSVSQFPSEDNIDPKSPEVSQEEQASSSDAQQAPEAITDKATQPQRDARGEAATAAAPAAGTGGTASPPNPYMSGWKNAFTLPSPLTEFQGLRPGPTILVYDVKRATPIASLTLALIKSGATALSDPLRRLVLRWRRIYDYTFGGPMCAKRAALSLFPGREHYIAPHPSRQHPNGRPHCSVMEQAKTAATSGVGIAEALGVEDEIRYPFSTLIKPFHIDRSGHRLIDSLVRAVYAQRAKTVHAFAGALALAGSYDAPYDRKRYSGRVLVEFLIARSADNSFLSCPIHKIIELEDEIVSATPQKGPGATSHGTADEGTVTDRPDSGSGAAGDASATENAESTQTSPSAASADGTRKRRKRFKLEPAGREVCTNEQARAHLEKTVYDFVVIAAPLEDSPLTIYRRVPLQTPEKKDTKTAEQHHNSSNQENDSSEAVENNAPLNGFSAEDEDTLKEGEPQSRPGATSGQKTATADTTSSSTQAYQGQLEEQNDFQGQKEGDQRTRQKWESQWTLQEVPVMDRPHVSVHITCAAADGLAKYHIDEQKLYGRRRRNEYLERPTPTTVLTSDSLPQEYYSFGELYVATCHEVVDSEFEQSIGTSRKPEEGRSPLLLFLSKREDQKRRKRGAAKGTEGEGSVRDTTDATIADDDAKSTETSGQDQGAAPEIREWKVDTDLLTPPSSIRIHGQQKEPHPPTVKTLYYTGKSVPPAAAEGFFSRIKEAASIGRHFGKTICCAVTAEELDGGDLSDIFKNVSHTDRRSWCFARPILYPIVEEGKREHVAGSTRGQTYVWGEKEELPPSVPPEVTNFVLLDNVFYSSAFESVVSFSEGAVMSAKNAANLIIKEVMRNYDD